MPIISEYSSYGGNSGVSGRLMRLLDNLNRFLEGDLDLYHEDTEEGSRWYVDSEVQDS